MVRLQDVEPARIESESFAIIEREFEEQTGRKVSDYPDDQFTVIRRIIHATGDFSITGDIVFQHDAIMNAVENIRSGMNILTDVNMAASGISRTILSRFGGEVICRIGDSEVSALARERNITRSEAAISLSVDDNVGIIAVGNAPTALVSAIRHIEEGAFPSAVIVGVPVGFVNAAESKEMLRQTSIPAILLRGRRGGSPVAAAAINAILRLL